MYGYITCIYLFIDILPVPHIIIFSSPTKKLFENPLIFVNCSFVNAPKYCRIRQSEILNELSISGVTVVVFNVTYNNSSAISCRLKYIKL